ncbi:MAG: cytochrome c biogenesis protein CcdA [Candidatus Ancaeobacter aquaticus]|nr:cytochrome c biogenesis protein CcdA [Candidatus Ancaeobacter aquaticus]
MEQTQTVNIFIAFLAGLLSFLSPCILPLIPSYLFFITGLSVKQLSEETQRAKVRTTALLNSVSFVLGFTLVFCALGATASFIGQKLFEYQYIIMKVGGAFIILFGIHLTGIFSFGFLQKEKKVHVRSKKWGYLGSFIVGLAFGAGWTPCVGPILGSILVMAGTTGEMYKGVILLGFYSLGIGLPFIFATLAVNTFLGLLERFKKWIKVFSILSGVFLIIVGILLFTNQFTVLSNWLVQITTN